MSRPTSRRVRTNRILSPCVFILPLAALRVKLSRFSILTQQMNTQKENRE